MFKILLSPETRKRIDTETQEISRLFGLTDRWLGEALISLARSARAEVPQLRPDNFIYDDTFVWHVVPEIAHRLGVTQFQAFEREDYEIRRYSNQELRERAGYCLGNISSSCYYAKPGWSLLLHESANGNPVVFAVDRLAGGDIKDPDVITRRLVEIAGYRGVEYAGRWTPSMMK